MGATDQRHFDALRAAHYPPHRNHIAAHITLFYQLPPSALDELDRLARLIVADTASPLAEVSDIYSLGGGTAFRVESGELMSIRARIADHFHGLLGAQDRGTPRLHITIQNKVQPAEARALVAELRQDFRPRPLEVTGLAAWHYRGGPWEPAVVRKFRGARR